MHRTLPHSRVLAMLCDLVFVFPLSSNCIGVASGSGTEIGGASTCCSGICACSAAEHGNHSSVFLQLCRIWVLHTCPEILSTRAWQHCLTTWAEHEPIALLRCFTNAHNGKTDICFVVSDLKLATISQTKTWFLSRIPVHRIVLSRVSLVPPSATFWSKPLGKMLAPAQCPSSSMFHLTESQQWVSLIVFLLGRNYPLPDSSRSAHWKTRKTFRCSHKAWL